jgi:hypothetical protein
MQPEAVTANQDKQPGCKYICSFKYILRVLKDGETFLCLSPIDQGSIGHYIGNLIVLVKN